MVHVKEPENIGNNSDINVTTDHHQSKKFCQEQNNRFTGTMNVIKLFLSFN